MDSSFFFFNDTATTEIYTLSLHDALPISGPKPTSIMSAAVRCASRVVTGTSGWLIEASPPAAWMCSTNAGMSAGPGLSSRSEEHTSELQSRQYLVCRLLLENKNMIRLRLL